MDNVDNLIIDDLMPLKSKCTVCTQQCKSWSSELNEHVLFTIDGSAIENVSSWPHLGHNL